MDPMSKTKMCLAFSSGVLRVIVGASKRLHGTVFAEGCIFGPEARKRGLGFKSSPSLNLIQAV